MLINNVNATLIQAREKPQITLLRSKNTNTTSPVISGKVKIRILARFVEHVVVIYNYIIPLTGARMVKIFLRI